MQRHTALKADAGEDDIALTLVVDAELFRLEGVERWLTVAEARLRHDERVVAVPAPQTPEVQVVTSPGGRSRRTSSAGREARR